MYVIMLIDTITGQFYPYCVTRDANKAKELCSMMHEKDKDCNFYAVPVIDADKEITIKAYKYEGE